MDPSRFRIALGLLASLVACTKAPDLSNGFDSNGSVGGSTGRTEDSGDDAANGSGDDTGGTAASTVGETGVSGVDSSGAGPGSATSTNDSGTTDGESGGSSAGDSSSIGPVDTCGDGIVALGEACDTDELAGEDCESQGYAAGELACADDCTFDLGDCSMPVCAMDAVPIGGACPVECTAGCDMGTITCNFDCSGNDCDDATIDCPAGWACFVDCDGTTACDAVVVNCPDHACAINCGGTVACEGAEFNCGAGTCTVLCDGTSPCEGSTMNCGTRDSTLTCNVTAVNPAPVANPDPGSSCACETVDC